VLVKLGLAVLPLKVIAVVQQVLEMQVGQVDMMVHLSLWAAAVVVLVQLVLMQVAQPQVMVAQENNILFLAHHYLLIHFVPEYLFAQYFQLFDSLPF
jgi:hypothetical protein